jgi:hypothetical protein
MIKVTFCRVNVCNGVIVRFPFTTIVTDVYVKMVVVASTTQSPVVSQYEPFQTGSPEALTFPIGPMSKTTSALSTTKAAKPMEIILFMCKYPLAKESED